MAISILFGCGRAYPQKVLPMCTTDRGAFPREDTEYGILAEVVGTSLSALRPSLAVVNC